MDQGKVAINCWPLFVLGGCYWRHRLHLHVFLVILVIVALVVLLTLAFDAARPSIAEMT